MAAEDTSWVFDSLVGFLQGPIWNAPVLTFIEQKCAIFDTGDTEHEEEYRKVHDEYKDLVDVMLQSHMEDIGITPEQFEEACGQRNIGKVNFHESLFEQVWAANDYEIFKRMMIQKNLELQLQALEMIQQKYGITPQSYLPDDETKLPAEEAQIMEEVLKKTVEEYKTASAIADEGTRELEQSLISEERQRLEAECRREKSLLQSAILQTAEADAELPEADRAPAAETISNTAVVQEDRVDAEEVARRQQYLRAQRDKLLLLKKQEREKKLRAAAAGSAERPRSARAARAALSSGGASAGGASGAPDTDKAGGADSANLQVRRALARRLKSEVVGAP
ncbi:cilia- and flagella-associated protein 36 [Schistocerca serialis cubense]|uniref:cilia- and flagella-associated protein 36 n=1 Tax=Schistocerca serialis cubense TaxID=2023355 RepID=UPI00214EA7B3|nr:cilia- and flagella-associated protein 36 [Schistocerca serialis cubense]